MMIRAIPLAFCLACTLIFSNIGIADLPESRANLQSKHTVSQTIERLERMLKQTQVRVYGIIDYQALAKKYGHTMPPMQAILFAAGRDGAQLVQTTPVVALDLPLRVLVHEDRLGVVWVTYHKANFLVHQHGLSKNNVSAQRLADGLYKLVTEAAN